MLWFYEFRYRWSHQYFRSMYGRLSHISLVELHETINDDRFAGILWCDSWKFDDNLWLQWTQVIDIWSTDQSKITLKEDWKENTEYSENFELGQ